MIHSLRALRDNYIYALELKSGAFAVIDPSEARPVQTFLKSHGGRIAVILNTHHHHDHVGGNEELRAPVICSRYDQSRIPAATRGVDDGERFWLEDELIETLFIPGHTLGHVGYYLPQRKVLFSGDTLFSLGCGRLLEGTAEQLFSSLNRLRELPDDTQIYCGHEYTLRNLEFALSLENSAELQAEKKRLLALGDQSSLPTRLDYEKRLNPFLRVGEFKKTLKMEGASEIEVFRHLRRLRDKF